MSSYLLEVEEGLRTHFDWLKREKSALKSPVFAIEHPLSKEELAKLRAELASSLRLAGEMSSKYKLCWIVHSAEHGYDFAGLEFWESFAKMTPNWSVYGNKYVLRSWYREFAKAHGGIQPQGDWGKHYTFIAWPIANALAPLDLQVHLARTLFNARYFLRETQEAPAEMIGRFISPYAENPSSRFQFFLEQSSIVGYLVRGLLEGIDKETVIYRPTLQRITNDLNGRANAREWLRDARRQYSRTIFYYGRQNEYRLSNGDDGGVDEGGADPIAQLRRSGVLLKPRIVLTRREDDSWVPVLRIPGFQPLVDIRQEFRAHLLRSKFVVPAHGDQLFLGATLLTGAPLSRTLRSWPAERECVLRFNTRESYFDQIVSAECQMDPSNIWLFQDRRDGGATLITGGQVRAGASYIVVARNADAINALGKPTTLKCDGAHAVALDLPNPLGSDLSHRLERAGLSIARRLRLQPVGLRPRQWTEDGFGEWLSSETPTLVVYRDFEFDALTIEFVGLQPEEIKCGPGTEPAFMQLRNLPIGRHHLQIKATKLTGNLGAYRAEVASASLHVYIRPPTSWAPGKLALSALVVSTDPPIPTLDDLFNHSLDLQVAGDSSRSLTISLRAIDENGAAKLTDIAKNLRSPLDSSVWHSALQSFLDGLESELPYFTATSTGLVIAAEDVGEQRVALEIPAKPLRWAYSHQGTAQKVLLLNDGVEEAEIEAAFYPFARPNQQERLDVSALSGGIDVGGKHGLYQVRGAGIEIAIVVGSAATRGHGLEFLQAGADSEALVKLNIRQLIALRTLWCSARAVNKLGRYKRNSLCGLLHRAVLAKTCTEYWCREEQALTSNSTELDWSRLEEGVHPRSFAICLTNAWKRDRPHTRSELADVFSEIAHSFKLASYKEARAVWALATESAPSEHSTTNVPIGAGLETLMKGARLMWRSQELGRRRDL
ncbi:hypothetical protein GHT07_04230 [Caenimonas koreensis DSM 17982]|uniref:Uncharacterized protein n=1 Tax=Caenimonas koreensis DSM 17982 TaxID=1121255 RepID=A0A844AQD8_9BURK|nr:hypothetical protein [Caenimonas koreensis]MRD46470.1 hypothetical protein [Caenimonas koreensis DSM 17982]